MAKGSHFPMRYVQTARHQAEDAAGEAIFGKLSQCPIPTSPVRGKGLGPDRCATPTPICYAGAACCWRRKMAGPIKVDPQTLGNLSASYVNWVGGKF